MQVPGHDRRSFSWKSARRLERVLAYMLDESEFLSHYGLRSFPAITPDIRTRYRWTAGATGEYEPGESSTVAVRRQLNWRGPVWFPVNYLLIESLRTLDHYFGPDFRVECPTGSGVQMTLAEVADEIARRLARLFLTGADGRRPVFGGEDRFDRVPEWHAHVPFHEYFHADTGKGMGASTPTGWTALIALLLAGNTVSPFTRGGNASGSRATEGLR